MALSTEAIISFVGVLINLPPALLILWKLCKRKRKQKIDNSGITIIVIFFTVTSKVDMLLGEEHGHELRMITEPRRRTTVVTLVLEPPQ